MNFFTLLFIGIGLAMDAFAVSICEGLKIFKIKDSLKVAFTYAFFQGLMPLIGYLCGFKFQAYIESIDHWIAFILLSIIGINMIKESFQNEECVTNINFKELVITGIATSIDALVVGITFAFLKVNISEAVIIIALTTFILSLIGVYIGHAFGSKYKNKAELVGGIILIIIGLKILLEHLGIF